MERAGKRLGTQRLLGVFENAQVCGDNPQWATEIQQPQHRRGVEVQRPQALILKNRGDRGSLCSSVYIVRALPPLLFPWSRKKSILLNPLTFTPSDLVQYEVDESGTRG